VALLGPPVPWVRREARRGIWYTRQWRGLTVLSTWPRHRKARRSALQRQREYDFASVVLAIKWLDPELVKATRDEFAGSQILWRDYLMAVLYGTAFALTNDEGRTIYPRQFYEKVSRSLDLLGAETGALLTRGAGQWQTITPGPLGSKFTARGPGLTPHWT
jgi:hypothetical protein